jgi:hypothetical protein
MLRSGISAGWPAFGEIDRICSRRRIGGFRYKATVGFQPHLLNSTDLRTISDVVDSNRQLDPTRSVWGSRDVRPSRGAREYVGGPFMQVGVAHTSDAVGARGPRLW